MAESNKEVIPQYVTPEELIYALDAISNKIGTVLSRISASLELVKKNVELNSESIKHIETAQDLIKQEVKSVRAATNIDSLDGSVEVLVNYDGSKSLSVDEEVGEYTEPFPRHIVVRGEPVEIPDGPERYLHVNIRLRTITRSDDATNPSTEVEVYDTEDIFAPHLTGF